MQNTKDLVTPSGRKVTIRSLLSYNDLEPALTIEDNIQKGVKMLEIAITSFDSVDGVITIGADIVKALRAGPIADYVFITKEVKKIVDGDFPQAK